MKIEELRLENFWSFGPEFECIKFSDGVTTLIGGNGAGKTAMLTALSRLFGISRAQRTVVKSDFHVSHDSDELASGTQLTIEVISEFPELDDDDEQTAGAVAEFWRQMAASGVGEPLKVRIRLVATWTDDGTPEGSIEEEVRWINRLDEDFVWDECQKVAAADRTAVQMIYIPARRNASDQVKALLRGRLWRAAKWSDELLDTVGEHALAIQDKFTDEEPISFIEERLKRRWRQVHHGDTDSDPVLRLLEERFEVLVRKSEIRFQPMSDGLERELERLSDGQKSLFQIALTAATLEIEQEASDLSDEDSPFDQSKIRRVQLTLLAIEEPENSLSPFFLSRIMSLAGDIGEMDAAQVLIASHSSSMLSRVEPEDIRYFRQEPASRRTHVRALTLPENSDDARAYVRLAVRAYPELYFARFVVLAEGDSERIVIPRIAAANDVPLDQSFVPIVPLGGRYVAHFWRLLSDLEIPFATLLDLDFGRRHGGPAVVRSVVQRLAEIGVNMAEGADALEGEIDFDDLDDLNTDDFLDTTDEDARGYKWLAALRKAGVFFSDPLDIDFSMMSAFPDAYQVAPAGMPGPRMTELAIANKKKRTLKEGGDVDLYNEDFDTQFAWYPYLFMQKSKPEAHLTALSRIEESDLRDKSPDELSSLVKYVADQIDLVTV